MGERCIDPVLTWLTGESGALWGWGGGIVTSA